MPVVALLIGYFGCMYSLDIKHAHHDEFAELCDNMLSKWLQLLILGFECLKCVACVTVLSSLDERSRLEKVFTPWLQHAAWALLPILRHLDSIAGPALDLVTCLEAQITVQKTSLYACRLYSSQVLQ